MVNFDDMTLEELQKLLRVNTKNPDEVKRIQEISGLTGKSIDGIWGKQTSKAWNNFLDKNQSDIEQAISDEQKYQNAIARGQNSPAVVDLVDFSNQLDEQQQARDEQQQARDAKIAQLEQQIAQVKERIARNKRALSGKSYEDVNNQIAALEMKKINSQDPSMIWRWQQQRQDTKNANDVVKKNTANKFVNEVEALTKTSISPDYAEQVQQLRNVRNKIAEGKTLGYDVSGLEEMEKAIQAKVDKTYGNIESVKTIRNKLKNLDQQLADKTITAEQYTAGVNMLKGADFDDDELRNELDTKSMLGNKKGVDAGNAAIEKKAKELAEKDGEDWNELSATAKANYRKKAGGK